MKQENKELLLQDLCGRLTYGVKGRVYADAQFLSACEDYHKSLEDYQKNLEDYQKNLESFKNTLESIFPELNESEDEKIRKHLITLFKNEYGENSNARFAGIKVKDIIAWLEKQGELKSSKWTDGDVVRHGGVLALVTNGRKAMKSNCEQITIQYPDEWVKAETKERKHFFEELEKQGKKSVEEYNITGITSGHATGKLAEIIKGIESDKAEPKFKVGDWVVNKFGDVWHIDSFDKKNYQVSDVKGNYIYFPISKQDEMHLWSIADAEEGDVLALSYESQNYILIYKGLHEKDLKTIMSVFRSYYVEEDTYDDETDNFHEMNTGEIITPATKKQRDLLFKK